MYVMFVLMATRGLLVTANALHVERNLLAVPIHTQHRAASYSASLSLARMVSGRIEPEIVFTMKRPLDPGDNRGRGDARGGRIDRARLRDRRLRLRELEVPARRLCRRLRSARCADRWRAEGHCRRGYPCTGRGAAAVQGRTVENGALVEEGSGRNSLRSRYFDASGGAIWVQVAKRSQSFVTTSSHAGCGSPARAM
jgi:hypothetical protein